MLQVLRAHHNFEPQPFKVVEANGLEVVASTLPAMESPPYKC
jgi:hypothetical protein